MKPFFQHEFLINDAHVDCFGRLKPSMLLFFCQEIAGQHCHILDADYDTLAQKNLLWAIIRQKVQITRLPVLGERITVETWPMPTTKVAYPRSVVAYDANGQELFRSISLWVLMDDRSRAMVLPGKSGVVVDGTLTGTELSVPRAIATRPMEKETQRVVGYTLLDRNGHMNNTRYLDWVDDLLPAMFHREKTARAFTVCYLNEAREGHKLDLSWDFPEEGCLQIDAHRNQEDKSERIFAAKILFD